LSSADSNTQSLKPLTLYPKPETLAPSLDRRDLTHSTPQTCVLLAIMIFRCCFICSHFFTLCHHFFTIISYVCMYVYIYVYIVLHIYVYYIYIYIQIYVYIYILCMYFLYMCILYIHICVWIYVYIYINVQYLYFSTCITCDHLITGQIRGRIRKPTARRVR